MNCLNGQKTFGDVPDHFEKAVHNVLHEEEKQVKKMRYQPILVVLTIMLLCGFAYAAANWGVKEATTFTDIHGNQTANEYLHEQVQSVNTVYENDDLRIEVIDAVFEGESLVVAWNATNKNEDKPIYVLLEKPDGGIDWNAGEISMQGTDALILADSTAAGFINARIYDSVDDDQVNVKMRFLALEPTVDIVYQDSIPDDHKGMLVASVVGEYGRLLSDTWYSELEEQAEKHGPDTTRKELMISTGKFAMLGSTDISFSIKNTANKQSLLPMDRPVEKDFGEFTMRIASAEYTLDSIIVTIDAMFGSEEIALRYTDYSGNGRGVGFVALDQEGQDTWATNYNSNGPITKEPYYSDGVWIMQYEIVHRGIGNKPEKITICPYFNGTLDAIDFDGVDLVVP